MENRKPNSLEKFIQYRALAYRFQNDPLEDAVSQALENSDEVGGFKVTNICFRDSQEFSDTVKRYAKMLGVSNRVFMKRAIVHAMELADEAMDEALDDWPETDGDQPTDREDMA
jgi:hypothetical protein